MAIGHPTCSTDAFDGQGAITEVQLEAFDERQVFSQLPGSGEPMWPARPTSHRIRRDGNPWEIPCEVRWLMMIWWWFCIVLSRNQVAISCLIPAHKMNALRKSTTLTTLYAKQTRGPQKLHRRVLFCDLISYSRVPRTRDWSIRVPVEDMFNGSLAHDISRNLKKRGYDINSKNWQNSCKFNTHHQVPLAKPSASSAAVIFARPQGSRHSGVQRDAGGWHLRR